MTVVEAAVNKYSLICFCISAALHSQNCASQSDCVTYDVIFCLLLTQYFTELESL